jgi:hypothetical protein
VKGEFGVLSVAMVGLMVLFLGQVARLSVRIFYTVLECFNDL